MKSLRAVTVLSVTLAVVATLAIGCDSEETPRLSVSGGDILDPSGAPIILRGWNWGQWGTMQPQDAADNAGQGANVVRIPLRWWGNWGDGSIDARRDDAPGHIDPAHLALLDETIQAATAQHLWVDLFVDSNCGQASIANGTIADCGAGDDGLPASFRNDPDAKQAFIEVWRFLVDRYASTPYIGMYEILPEPSFTCSANGCDDWSAAPAFYASVIPEIRAIDPRTPILIGADGAYEIRKIATAYIPDVDGLIYTGDFLNGASQKPDLVAIATDFRATYHVPVFIQQVGVRASDPDATGAANDILSAFAQDGIGWTWWTYRESHSGGDGFAPYSLDQDGTTWNVNADWLALISGKLASSP